MEYIYGALLLHKLGKPVNEENIKKVIEATGEKPDDGKIKALVASLQGVEIDKELESASIAAPAGAAEGKAEEKAEEKEEEKKEEAAEGLSALFG